MTKLLVLVLCFGMITILNSQKLIVTIDDIKYDNFAFSGSTSFIKQSFEKQLLKYKGVIVVDRDQTLNILKERELQKNESFIDGVTVKQDKALGAQYFMNINYIYDKNEMTLRIVSVETGAVRYVKTFSLKDFINPKTCKILREDFLDRYIKEIVLNLISELDLNDVINLVKIEKNKKNNEAILHCPEGCYLRENDELIVYYIKDSEYNLKENVGKVRITRVENAKVYVAEIKNGAKDIINSMDKKLKCYVQY